MAKLQGPRDLGSQVDIVHPNCGVHMAAVLHDEKTGAAVFKCQGCNLTVAVSYFDENPPGEQPEEKGPEEPAPPKRAKRRSPVAIAC